MCHIFFYLIIPFWLHCIFVAVPLSLVAASRDYPPVPAQGLLTAVASLVSEHGLFTRGLRSCGARAFVALQHVQSSRSRDRTVSPALAGEFLTTESPGEPGRAAS